MAVSVPHRDSLRGRKTKTSLYSLQIVKSSKDMESVLQDESSIFRLNILTFWAKYMNE